MFWYILSFSTQLFYCDVITAFMPFVCVYSFIYDLFCFVSFCWYEWNSMALLNIYYYAMSLNCIHLQYFRTKQYSNATPIRWIFSFNFICLDADYICSVYKHKNWARMATANILIFIFSDSLAIMMAPEPNTVRKNSERKRRRRQNWKEEEELEIWFKTTERMCMEMYMYMYAYAILSMYFILVIEAAIGFVVVAATALAVAAAVVVTLNLFNLHIYTEPISVYIFRIFYIGYNSDTHIL